MQLPKPLFKYMKADRAIQILKDKSIRFTQPKYFNDPFELLPTLDMKAIKEAYIKFPDIERKLKAGEDRKTILKGLENFTMGVANGFIEDYNSVGVLSLSARNDIPLMWSHYCSNHSGIVIGFDVEKGILLEAANSSDRESYCDIGPVDYNEKRLRFPNPNFRPLDPMFYKDCCWKYENEWRAIRSLKTLERVDEEIYVARFNPEAIRCVIFGLSTSRKDTTEILKLLHSDEYKHVGSFTTVLNSDSYSLDISTSIGVALDKGELEFEKYKYEHIEHFYKLVSKGDLYKAMEIIDENVKFAQEKDYCDFY